MKQSKCVTLISLDVTPHFFIIWQCYLQETTRRGPNFQCPKQIALVLEMEDSTARKEQRVVQCFISSPRAASKLRRPGTKTSAQSPDYKILLFLFARFVLFPAGVFRKCKKKAALRILSTQTL